MASVEGEGADECVEFNHRKQEKENEERERTAAAVSIVFHGGLEYSLWSAPDEQCHSERGLPTERDMVTAKNTADDGEKILGMTFVQQSHLSLIFSLLAPCFTVVEAHTSSSESIFAGIGRRRMKSQQPAKSQTVAK